MDAGGRFKIHVVGNIIITTFSIGYILRRRESVNPVRYEIPTRQAGLFTSTSN